MRVYFLILLVSLYYTSSNAEEDYGFEIIDLPSTTDESFEIVDWPTTTGETFEKVDKETTDESFEIIDNPKGDPELAAYIREALENFRKQMTNGIPEIKMPVLDPLVLDKDIDVDVNENVAKMHLLIKQLTVKGLSDFEIHDVVPSLEQLYTKFHLSLPEVSAEGYYKLNGKIMNIFPLYGDGDFYINVSKPEIMGEGKMEFTEDTLEMANLNLIFKWTNMDVNLENFLGGGKFSSTLQKLLPDIGKGVFDHFNPQVMAMINSALIKIINTELQKPEIKKIVKDLVPTIQ